MIRKWIHTYAPYINRISSFIATYREILVYTLQYDTLHYDVKNLIYRFFPFLCLLFFSFFTLKNQEQVKRESYFSFVFPLSLCSLQPSYIGIAHMKETIISSWLWFSELRSIMPYYAPFPSDGKNVCGKLIHTYAVYVRPSLTTLHEIKFKIFIPSFSKSNKSICRDRSKLSSILSISVRSCYSLYRFKKSHLLQGLCASYTTVSI